MQASTLLRTWGRLPAEVVSTPIPSHGLFPNQYFRVAITQRIFNLSTFRKYLKKLCSRNSFACLSIRQSTWIQSWKHSFTRDTGLGFLREPTMSQIVPNTVQFNPPNPPQGEKGSLKLPSRFRPTKCARISVNLCKVSSHRTGIGIIVLPQCDVHRGICVALWNCTP